MESVGIRELRQRASELLRLVERGRSVQITDRGRPVAVLAPLPDTSPLDRLRSSGACRPSDPTPRGAWPEPLVVASARTASDALAELRRDER
jgi:prevent-host-death family protein